MIVCHCHAVSDGTIREVCAGGARDVEDIRDACGAGGDCGGCHRRIERVLAQARPVPVLLAS